MRRIFYKKLSLPGKGILSEDFFRFVRVHGCFYVYTQIQTVFINTFLQKAIGDTNSVMEYNISVYLVQPVAMLLSVFLMHAFKSPLRTPVSYTHLVRQSQPGFTGGNGPGLRPLWDCRQPAWRDGFAER